MSSDTIFVTEENTTKRRDYEDYVVKTFYLTNTTSVQEFQEIANAVRTATDIRRCVYLQRPEGPGAARNAGRNQRWPKN